MCIIQVHGAYQERTPFASQHGQRQQQVFKSHVLHFYTIFLQHTHRIVRFQSLHRSNKMGREKCQNDMVHGSDFGWFSWKVHLTQLWFDL